MDDLTRSAYNQYGTEFSKRYRSGTRISIECLNESFAGCGTILEIGTGSGIDFSRLLDAGYEMTGLEPSETLIEEAHTYFPQTKGKIIQGSLPFSETLRTRWERAFDGIYASAVLMHIAENLQHKAMRDLAFVLKPQGRILLKISETRHGLDAENRDEFGRFYLPMPPTFTFPLFESSGFRVLRQWDDEDHWNRRGLDWKYFLLEKFDHDPLSIKSL